MTNYATESNGCPNYETAIEMNKVRSKFPSVHEAYFNIRDFRHTAAL